MLCRGECPLLSHMIYLYDVVVVEGKGFSVVQNKGSVKPKCCESGTTVEVDAKRVGFSSERDSKCPVSNSILFSGPTDDIKFIGCNLISVILFILMILLFPKKKNKQKNICS